MFLCVKNFSDPIVPNLFVGLIAQTGLTSGFSLYCFRRILAEGIFCIYEENQKTGRFHAILNCIGLN